MDLTFLHQATGAIATVSIRGKEVLFGTVDKGITKYAPMEGVNLNVAGILKEHPDLKGKPLNYIKKEAIKRFKKKLFGYATDKERIDYLQEDLGNFGFKLIMYQLKGGGPIKVN